MHFYAMKIGIVKYNDVPLTLQKYNIDKIASPLGEQNDVLSPV